MNFEYFCSCNYKSKKNPTTLGISIEQEQDAGSFRMIFDDIKGCIPKNLTWAHPFHITLIAKK